MARWFVARTSVGSNTILGPYEEQDLKGMIQHGQVAWQDQVSRGGDDPWRPIIAVPEIAQDPNLAPMMPQSPVGGAYYMNVRSHVAAGLLAILLGTFGAHKFYNGSWGWGIIEGILYLVDPAAYDRKYNRTPEDPWKW
jgi:hypothetical protein